MDICIDVGILVGTGLASGLILFCIGGWIINYWHDVIRANEGCIKEYREELCETRQELAESKQNAITLQGELDGLRNEYNKAVAGEKKNNECAYGLDSKLATERNKNNDLTNRVDELEGYFATIMEVCKNAEKDPSIPF